MGGRFNITWKWNPVDKYGNPVTHETHRTGINADCYPGIVNYNQWLKLEELAENCGFDVHDEVFKPGGRNENPPNYKDNNRHWHLTLE